jgi:superfamily II DNA or RNA helicase
MTESFNIQLDDLVYEYPDVTDPRFQTLISSKQEFRELSSQVSEPIPNRGEFFRHQLLVHRYVLMYDRLLITHRTGTGKTCALGGASEMFKRSMIHAASNFINLYMIPQRTHIKKVYILVRNETLELQFKQEIACKCSQEGDYMTPAVLQATDTKAMRSAVTREINKYYKITTYGNFAKKILQNYYEDGDLKRLYSGSLFIIDEVHNIRIDPTKLTEDKDMRKTYDALHRLFHVIDRSKVILATATPMTNIAGEIAPIMNLILPLDLQMPVPTKKTTKIGPDIDVLIQPPSVPASSTPISSSSITQFTPTPSTPFQTTPMTYDYTNPSLEFLEPYFNGRVSYIREADISTDVEYKGSILQAKYVIGGRNYKSQQIIYARPMIQSTPQKSLIGPDGQPFPGQNYYYEQARNIKQDVVRTRERQAANLVYPDGTYGGEGFKKFVIKQKKGYSPTPQFSLWLQNLEYMNMLSSKFAEIIRITNLPENADKSTFCYIPYVSGSGAIDLSLCFQSMGYDLFDRKTPIFGKVSGGKQTYCAPSKESSSGLKTPDRVSIMTKHPRVALFIGEGGSRSLNANILETFNSPENRHGEYIKVLIVSPLGREGINTANVQNIHIVSPEWTQTSIYQATSRVLRATSHVDLLNERRQELIGLGDNPDHASVKVSIYQHASILADGQASIDVNMYEHIERKDIEIKKIERIMKQSAIDCQLHRNRNIRIGDEDWSAICDYDVCNYRCAQPDPLPDEIDYDSYDVLYSGPTVEVIMDEIKEIYKTEFGLTFTEIYTKLEDYRRKFVDMALEQIITSKVRLNDRFGYTSYLREDNGVVYLQRDYPLVDSNNDQNDYSLAMYSKNLIAVNSVPLSEYQPEVGVVVQPQLLHQIYQLVLPRETQQLESLLEQINLDTLIALVEQLIIEHSKGQGNQLLLQGIMGIYSHYIDDTDEPSQTIRETKSELTKVRGGGRRVKETKVGDVQVTITDTDTGDNPIVYYHTLDSKRISGTSYTDTTDFFKVRGKIRLYKPEEGSGKWRDADPAEQLVYTKLSQDKLNVKRNQFEQNMNISVYGIVLRSDNELRLFDMDTFRQKMKEPGFVVSKKTKPRGKRCNNMNLTELINILYYLKLMPHPQSRLSAIIDKNRLIQKIHQQSKSVIPGLSDMELNKLQFMDTWYESGRTIKDICGILREDLTRRGWIWII